MAVDFDKLMSVFREALEEHPPEDWDDFVQKAAGADEELCRQARQLLHTHAHGHSLLDKPVVPSPTLNQPITEKPGAQIGPYKLLQQLGEGGMGVVYMAEQKEPVKRRIALKIIKPGMDTRQVIARFEAERQALAMMDHPNIAKVLDAGATESGRPYFVMELVNGLPVTKYCDEQHLTPKERLELFVPICQAVQHAHQKGIIHRDLKPSNILVALYDGQPVPKVIDFGVAKATNQTLTEKTMFTQLGQVVGTLEYMSPEQAERNQLDIDTRSDIYSLGVVLYELLTGETPFDRTRLRSAAFDELLRIIREEEPSKPSTKVGSSQSLPSIAANRRIDPARLGSTIRGELDWIVMKALEKDRGRRYETASKFAEDVQHYLNDEAVVACPPSIVYRFRKSARRNKVVLTASTMVALSLLLAVGGIGWTARAHIALEAEAKRNQVDRQQRLANQVELILNEVDRLVAGKQWSQALSTARRSEAIINSGDADLAIQLRVKQVLTDLLLVQELENARLHEAQIVEGNWNLAGAARAYARAFRKTGFDIDRTSVENAAARLRLRSRILQELAEALAHWAMLRRKLDPEKGNFSWQHLTAITDAIDSDSYRRSLREICEAEEEGAGVEALRKLAETVDVTNVRPSTLCLLARQLEDRVSAAAATEFLLEAYENYPNDFWINVDLGRYLVLSTPKRCEEAVGFYRAALALKPQNAIVFNNLGVALREQGRIEEAMHHFQRALEIDPECASAHNNLGLELAELGKLEEAMIEYHRALEIDPKQAHAHHNLGNALKAQGKLEEATVKYQHALESDPEFAVSHFGLGTVLARQHRLAEAIVEYRRAIEIDPEHAPAHNNLGVALKSQGKLDEAIEEYRRALKIDPEMLEAYENLGFALADQAMLNEAIAVYRQALRINPESAKSLFGLGNALKDAGDFKEAVTAYRQVIEIRPEHAEPHNNLGIVLREQGRVEEAMIHYRRALEIDPKHAPAHQNLGNVLVTQGKVMEAIAHFHRALEIDPQLAMAHNDLGTALNTQGKPVEAIAHYRKAIEIDPLYALAYNNLGQILSVQKKVKESIISFRKAIELDPKLSESHQGLGFVLATSGKLDDACRYLKAAIELDPSFALAHGNLGSVFAMQGNFDEAIRSLEKSIEIQPSGSAWENLGGVFHETGCWKRCIAAMQESLNLDQQNPRNCGKLAVMSVAHGELAKSQHLEDSQRIRHGSEARRCHDIAVEHLDRYKPKLNDGERSEIESLLRDAKRLMLEYGENANLNNM